MHSLEAVEQCKDVYAFTVEDSDYQRTLDMVATLENKDKITCYPEACCIGTSYNSVMGEVRHAFVKNNISYWAFRVGVTCALDDK